MTSQAPSTAGSSAGVRWWRILGIWITIALALGSCGRGEDSDDGTRKDTPSLEPQLTGRVASLAAALGAESLEDRSIAAHELGELGREAEAAAPALSKLLTDSAGTVRVTAAVAVFRVTGDAQKPLETLIEILHRGTTSLRVDAAHAIADMDQCTPAGIKQLTRLANGTAQRPDKPIYYDTGNVHVDPIPIGWTPASAAAFALGRVASPQEPVLKVLEQLGDSKREHEREMAKEALARIRARGPGSSK